MIVSQTRSEAKWCAVLPLGMAILNLPAAVVKCLHLVWYYLDAVEAGEALAEDCTDDRFHATGKASTITKLWKPQVFLPGHNYYGYIISFAEFVETLESIIDLNVCNTLNINSEKKSPCARQNWLFATASLQKSNVCVTLLPSLPFSTTLSSIVRKASLHVHRSAQYGSFEQYNLSHRKFLSLSRTRWLSATRFSRPIP